MALVVKDRVKETTTTTGTGSVTLAGASTGFQTFNSAIGTSNTTYYCIAGQGTSEWEVGLGTLSASTTLARTTVYASSNAGSLVNFSAGTKDVFVTYPASIAVLSVNGQNGQVSTTTHLGIGAVQILWNFSDTAVASGSTAISAASLGYATSAAALASAAIRTGNVTAPGAATNGPNTSAVTGTWQSMSGCVARAYDACANTTTAVPGLFVRTA